MAIVVIILVVLCCTAKVTGASHKHHLNKFHKTDDIDQFKKEGCSNQNVRLRNEIIEKSKCGEPKDVFVDIKPQVSYYRVIPSMVWVKRCVGLCDFNGGDCVANKTRMEPVPVRLYNSKTNRETCATVEVEVHESCTCCSTKASDCASPRVYNPPEPKYEVESF